MATWVTATTNVSGQYTTACKYSMAGGYGTVSRNGNTISFNFGFRVQWTSNTYTTNNFGVAATSPSGTAYVIGKPSTWSQNTWYYADSSEKQTTEKTPWSYSGTVSGTGAGTITITIGWTDKTSAPSSSNYSSYTFSVPYPALPTYTISYSKGSYSNLTNMPSSSQTKTHGININLSSTVPYYTESNVNGYVLTWNTNGGTGGAGTTTMKNTTKTTLKQWQSSRNSSLWRPGESYNGDGDVTMTAYSFNDPTITSYGTLTALPTQPTRTNYTFQSWNTKADGTGYTLGVSSGYTLPYQPNANTIFYAIWKRNQASIKIKTGTSTWSDGLVWVKDSNGTWQQVLKVYVKTGASTWTESSD